MNGEPAPYSLKALALDSPLRHVLGVTLDFMINVLKNGGGDKKVSQILFLGFKILKKIQSRFHIQSVQ